MSTTSLLSQKLNGIILYQNTGKAPAEGVKISGPGCNPVYSQDDGYFEIPCANKKPGKKVHLRIGTTDADGKQIEVVNSDAIKLIRMPADPDHEPVEIIVCPAGHLAEAINNLYNILEKNYDDNINKDIKEINEKLDQSNLDADVKANLLQQIADLEQQKEEAYSKIEEQAIYIASINRDQASEMLNKAISLIEQGQDIDSALVILDENKLEELYKNKRANIEKNENEIRGIIEAYKLKILSLAPRFKFDHITGLYDKIIQCYEDNDFDKEELAKILMDATRNEYDNGNFQTAISYQHKSIEILENIDDNDPILLGNAYSILGLLNHIIGKNQISLDQSQKAISMLLSVGDTLSMELASAYSNMAMAHKALNNDEKSLELFFKTLNIELNQDSRDEKAIAISFSNISWVLEGLERYEEAIKYGNKCIEIAEKVLKPNDPSLALYYSGLSGRYISIEDYENAEKYQLKAIEIREKILPPTHPGLAYSYHKWAKIKNARGETEIALEYRIKTVQIGEKSFPENHPYLATWINKLGVQYRILGDYEEALRQHFRALKIREENPEISQKALAVSYNDIGITYYFEGKYEKAAQFQEKSIEISEEQYAEDHQTLVERRLEHCLTISKINRHDEALNILRNLEKIYPDMHTIYEYRTIVNGCKSDVKKARNALKKAIEYGLKDTANILEDPCAGALKQDGKFMALINDMTKNE